MSNLHEEEWKPADYECSNYDRHGPGHLLLLPTAMEVRPAAHTISKETGCLAQKSHTVCYINLAFCNAYSLLTINIKVFLFWLLSKLALLMAIYIATNV